MVITVPRLALLVRIILILACIVPLVVSTSTIYPFVVTKALYSRILIEIAFALWLVLITVAPKNRPRRSWVLVGLGAWVCVATLATVVGQDPARSFWSTYERMTGVVDLAHWGVYALMLSSMFREWRRWRHLFIACICVSIPICVIGLLSYYFLDTDGALSFLFYKSRIGSTIGNPLFLGSYLSIIIGFIIVILPTSNSYASRIALISIMSLNMWTLWISASRSGLLAVVTMFIVLGLGYIVLDRRRYTKQIGIAIMSSVLVISTLIIMPALGVDIPQLPGGMTQRFINITSGNTADTDGRIDSMVVTYKGFQEYPILGVGPENFRILWMQHAEVNWSIDTVFDNSHNKFLEALATTGVVGITVYAALWILMLKVSICSVIRSCGSDRLTKLGMLSVALCYLVLCQVMIDDSTFLMCFAIIVAYLAHTEHGGCALPLINAYKFPVAAVMLTTLLVSSILVYSLWQFNIDIHRSALKLPPTHSVQELIYDLKESGEKFHLMDDYRQEQILRTAIRHSSYVSDHQAESLRDDIESFIADSPRDAMWPYLGAHVYFALAQHDKRYLEYAEYYAEILDGMITTPLITQRLRNLY